LCTGLSPESDGSSDAARDRHFAAHPEDRGANIVILSFTMMRKATFPSASMNLPLFGRADTARRGLFFRPIRIDEYKR